LPGRVWADGAADWFSDLATDQVFIRTELAARAGLQSAFAFPIKLSEEVFGVMEFFTRDPQTEDPTLLEVMTAIGNHVGQFLDAGTPKSSASKFSRGSNAPASNWKRP